MSRSRAERAACVALPDLPLQLLLRERPAWRGYPVAVAADDTPQALLTHVNREARAKGLRPGLTQGAARNLVLDLRTAVVSEAEVAALVDEMGASLRAFSPRVEPHDRLPGVFFIDPNGLSGIYGGLRAWARTVHRYLAGRSLRGSVVVGFHRHRTAIVARGVNGPLVLTSTGDETKRSNDCRLRDLELPETLCDPLAMLGIETLGAFLELPVGELHTRFGPDAAALHGLFADGAQLPMQPLRFEAPRRVVAQLEPPRRDHERLLFEIGPHLDGLLTDLRGRGERLTALCIELRLEPYGAASKVPRGLRTQQERIEPASPTDDRRTLLDLIRLRLASLTLPSGVEGITLEAEAVPIAGAQLDTPGERPQRDREAAARALARIRASYGERSVVRARLRDAHLPEARVRFEPISRLPKSKPSKSPASPTSVGVPPMHRTLLRSDVGGAGLLRVVPPQDRSERRPPRLQRRLFPTPRAVPTDAEGRPELGSPLAALHGPHRISGGWWGRVNDEGKSLATARDYYYAEVADGTIHWIFFDRRRRRWFVQGRVD